MATQVYPTVVQTAGENGACREFWVKMTGLVGVASGSSGIVNTVENPFNEDMLIWEALIIVTAGSGAVATDFDIGLGNTAAGGSSAAELANGLSSTQLNVTGPYELSLVKAIAGPPLKPLWKAPLTSTTADSWLCFDQNGSVNASTLRYTCLVKVIPQADLD